MDLGVGLGVAGIVVAVLVPLYIYIRERRYKHLAYYVLTNSPLFQKDLPREKVKLSVDDKVILGTLYQAVIRIGNTGVLPILAVDYEVPLAIELDGAKTVLAQVVDSDPQDLPITVTVEDDKCILQPALLNSGDWVTVQFLATGSFFRSKVKVTGRISGVREIRLGKIGEEKTRDRWWILGKWVFAGQIVWWIVILTSLINFGAWPEGVKTIVAYVILFSYYLLPLIMYLLARGLRDFFDSIERVFLGSS